MLALALISFASGDGGCTGPSGQTCPDATFGDSEGAPGPGYSAVGKGVPYASPAPLYAAAHVVCMCFQAFAMESFRHRMSPAVPVGSSSTASTLPSIKVVPPRRSRVMRLPRAIRMPAAATFWRCFRTSRPTTRAVSCSSRSPRPSRRYSAATPPFRRMIATPVPTAGQTRPTAGRSPRPHHISRHLRPPLLHPRRRKCQLNGVRAEAPASLASQDRNIPTRRSTR